MPRNSRIKANVPQRKFVIMVVLLCFLIVLRFVSNSLQLLATKSKAPITLLITSHFSSNAALAEHAESGAAWESL